MLNHTRVIETFPSVQILPQIGGLPVEVSLVAQLSHGSGDELYRSALLRQQQHASFVDELGEPSAKLGGTDFAKGDATSLYSFAVGPDGHPFHSHSGHRIFTAISGSGGAQLRFSTATVPQIAENPQHFINALRYINIPADCLFTVRFGGETWHQFQPLARNGKHPAFFALSCHTNELGGNLPIALKEKVLANEATIPSLTELLPARVQALLDAPGFDADAVPTTTLALDAAAGSLHRLICDNVRSNAGRMRSSISALGPKSGYLSYATVKHDIAVKDTLPQDSLLHRHLADKTVHHEDFMILSLSAHTLTRSSASELLETLLNGFLNYSPKGVSRLMRVRNSLVKPFGLRTSPLGCPVSTLLSDHSVDMFRNRFPVVDQRITADDSFAQVILGTDDKHLMFRSCVGVKIMDDQSIEISLGNRVHCLNAFGNVYMTLIELLHRLYIGPSMLQRAVDYALLQQNWSHAVQA